MTASDAVTDRFGFVEMKVLAFEDLYGGKLHAALDRQHPRDLFDVKLLYENEGITDELFRAFMVYVASSSRPIHELLAPNTEFNDALFNEEFVGMTRETVTRDSLIKTRVRLHADIRERLAGDVAAFLLSLHDAEPDFDMIGVPHASLLPAVRWKLLNLRRLKGENPEKPRGAAACARRPVSMTCPPIYSIHRRNLGILHHHRIPFPACIISSKSSRTARHSTQKSLPCDSR